MAYLNKRFHLYPSDRELTLRSRLNVGWSVHSHRDYCRHDSLSDSEVESILQVISRARNTEISEEQRIGILVERLENIKRNTYGHAEYGQRSCAMCGVPFTKFSRLPVFTCYDCTKNVCNKCCVDTQSVVHDARILCKICAEDRELWKKSGGWFYGSLPTYAKRSEKLSVSPGAGRATWEHRKPEIVSLQSFEAAESEINERFLHSSWANLSMHSGNDDDEDDLESPDEFRMTRSMYGSTDSGFLKPFDENLRREVSLQNMSPPQTNLTLPSMSLLSTSCPSLPHQMTTNGSSPQESEILNFSLVYNSKSQFLQCTISSIKGLHVSETKEEPHVSETNEEMHISEMNEELHISETNEEQHVNETTKEMIYVRIYTVPFSKKMNIMRTKSKKKSNTVEFNETIVFSKIRPEKLRRRMLRFELLHEDPVDDRIIGETGVDLTVLKPRESKFFSLPLKQDHTGEMQKTAGCGWILLSLKYLLEDHVLILGVIRCSSLVSSNKNGQLNSFVIVKLLPEFGDKKYESPVKHNTVNPRFNKQFFFSLSPLEMKHKSLMISVAEKTGKHSRNIGYVILGIQARGEMLQHWLEVIKKPKVSVDKWHALLKERN